MVFSREIKSCEFRGEKGYVKRDGCLTVDGGLWVFGF